MTPDKVPDAYPPRPFVTSHSQLRPASEARPSLPGQGIRITRSVIRIGWVSTARQRGREFANSRRESSGGVPMPPYLGSSLDHKLVHSESAGGASRGSGAGSRCRSTPRLTSNNRSSPRLAEKPQQESLRRENRAVHSHAASALETPALRVEASANRNADRKFRDAFHARNDPACSVRR